MNAFPHWTDRSKPIEPAAIEACTVTPVAAGPGALARELSKRIPEYHFRRILCRGGWYRLGGVLNARGEHISEDLEAWAEAALGQCGDDFDALLELCASQKLVATRRVGRTHYFVAQLGERPEDYLQLEIEDLQETHSHALGGLDPAPTQIDELVDPHLPRDHTGQPVGLPYYTFRRLTHVGDLLARIRDQQPEPQAIHGW